MRSETSILENVELLKKLVYLEHFKQSKSLQKTALHLKVTPSAVTQNIKWLEKKLGRTVLVRDTDGTRLTPYAEDLLNKSRDILNSLRPPLLGEKKRDLSISRLDLGVYDGLASLLLPEIVSKLQEHSPNIKFTAVSGRSDELVALIRKESLCAAFSVEGVNLEGLRKAAIYQDTLGVYVHRNNSMISDPIQLLAKKGFGTLKAPKSGQHTFYSRYIRQIEKISHVSFFSDSIEMLKSVAQQGGMPVVLPKKVATFTGTNLVELDLKSYEKFNGLHTHYFISPANCDEGEFEFLVELIKSVVSF